MRVVDEAGYAGTTAAAIAREAGLSKGLLWHYFADLDDLLEVTARHLLDVLQAAAGSRMDLDAPAPAVLRDAVRANAALRSTHRAERAVLEEIVRTMRTGEGALRFTAADFEPVYLAQEAIVRRGQSEGDLRASIDPRAAVLAFQGAVDAMMAHLDAHPEVAGDAFAEVVADVVLGGLVSER
ncbi:hypothetical protein GCM10011519_22310 [Marmoricola endophyticus]|uniref:HTH tetR-type domain-containing protein n=1 Tax=Marmoricola endophyticus TaxID=2040280 RepID=A0A917F3W5_9ACTN|nr:hypothetical protein GCM10011519_22310 [Marmoricola endophyticus]